MGPSPAFYINWHANFYLRVWLLWIPPFEFSEVTMLGLTFNTGYPYLLGVLVIMYIGATIERSLLCMGR